MPVPFSNVHCKPIRHDTGNAFRVEWQYDGRTLVRDYPYGNPSEGGVVHKSTAATQSSAFMGLISGPMDWGPGPAVQMLTDEELAERERAAELRRGLLESYVSCFVDRTDGAHALADELGFPAEQVREDAKIVAQYIRCRELHGRLTEAQGRLRDFHEAHAGDARADIEAIPSLRAEYVRLKLDIDAARQARRGMIDCMKMRPELFNGNALNVRLIGECVAA